MCALMGRLQKKAHLFRRSELVVTLDVALAARRDGASWDAEESSETCETDSVVDGRRCAALFFAGTFFFGGAGSGHVHYRKQVMNEWKDGATTSGTHVSGAMTASLTSGLGLVTLEPWTMVRIKETLA